MALANCTHVHMCVHVWIVCSCETLAPESAGQWCTKKKLTWQPFNDVPLSIHHLLYATHEKLLPSLPCIGMLPEGSKASPCIFGSSKE